MAKESTALAPLAIDPAPFIYDLSIDNQEDPFPTVMGLPMTPDRLTAIFQDYLNFCHTNDEQPTIGGLCTRIGVHRQRFWDWEVSFPCLMDTVKIIRDRILAEAERRLTTRRGLTNHVGLIFWLKNTFGWCDKQETLSQTVSVNVTIDGGENPELVRSLAAEYRARRLTGGNQGQLPAPVESKKE